jgi:antitoxin MazE
MPKMTDTPPRDKRRSTPKMDFERKQAASNKRRYILADLLRGMTPEAMHDAFDWGPDRGREVID